MRLFIAEKPSLARAIAARLGGIEKREDGYIRCRNGDEVSWCFGHLLELVDPSEYDERYKRWRLSDLPILPDTFRKHARDKDAQKQLKHIGARLKKASAVVHAGDPDREGQIIVDEVLEHLGYQGEVQRIWLASLDDESIDKALARIRPNADYLPLGQAAQARGQADWLYGLNLTRALTLIARAQGVGATLSVGRVQTPTLALVVQRELEIRDFKPVNYFVPALSVANAKGERFQITRVCPDEGEGIDANGYLTDRAVAERLLQSVGDTLTVSDSRRQRKSEAPPLPHSLSTLQQAMSKAQGLTAAQTLEAAQELYENKCTSYPRSDCTYLPEEQFSDAPGIVERLARAGVNGAEGANTTLRSKAWNTAKVSAHHAIIPTGESFKGKRNGADGVYAELARRYLMQFYPDYAYLSCRVEAKGEDGSAWSGKGKVVLEPGWRALNASNKDKDEALPELQKGETLKVLGRELLERATKPPARFDDGSLIEAMSQVHRFVTDPQIKARLKDNAGIGTEATRANIIETLVKRGWVERKGRGKTRKFHAATLGCEVIALLPKSLKDVGLTAMWEESLEQISEGGGSVERFTEQITTLVSRLVKAVEQLSFPGRELHRCPHCQGLLSRHESKKKPGKFYWRCQEDCEQSMYSDDDGKPGKPFGD